MLAKVSVHHDLRRLAWCNMLTVAQNLVSIIWKLPIIIRRTELPFANPNIGFLMDGGSVIAGEGTECY